MMALRVDKGNIQDYSKKAEELADAFRRALVMEQIPFAKAEEMTIDKTVELCRTNAQNNLVKSVLASTKFSNPKEVIAKFIVESNTTKQEAQVFALRKSQNRGNGSNRNGNYRNNGNNNRNGRYNNNGYNNNGNNRNRNGRYNNNNNNNRNNNNGYGNRNNNNGNNRNNDNRNNNNNQRNVRHAENATASQSTLGNANES